MRLIHFKNQLCKTIFENKVVVLSATLDENQMVLLWYFLPIYNDNSLIEVAIIEQPDIMLVMFFSKIYFEEVSRVGIFLKMLTIDILMYYE